MEGEGREQGMRREEEEEGNWREGGKGKRVLKGGLGCHSEQNLR
jgi:hypothetical protein